MGSGYGRRSKVKVIGLIKKSKNIHLSFGRTSKFPVADNSGLP